METGLGSGREALWRAHASLAVTGVVEKKHMKRNDTATAGCRLYLSKPLGIGILTTAEKKAKLRAEDVGLARDWMCTLNKPGSRFGKLAGVTAMTDVTGFGLLGHGHGFACEGRFIHLQLRNLDQPQVGRDLVARLQQHDVAGHQLSSGQDLHHAAAQHGGVCRRQLAQRSHGLVGAPGLHKADDGVEHYDDEDHQRVGDFAHQPRYDGRAQQHQHHEVLELVGQQTPPGAVLRFSQLIGAMGGAAAQGLVGMQACVGVDTMGLCNGFGGVQVRCGGWGHA